jgi:sporulation protein YqfC
MVRKIDNISKHKQESIKKNLKAAPKQRFREKLTEILELPKEIVLNMPKLTMLGNGDLIIENYKGIIEYSEGVVRLNTTTGIIKVMGADIYIKEITSENIMIYGNILSLQFLKNDN